MSMNSEKEYKNEVNEKWTTSVFILGAIICGYSVYTLATNYDMEAWVKIIMTLLSSFVGGKLLCSFFTSIRSLFILSLFLGMSYTFGEILWIN